MLVLGVGALAMLAALVVGSNLLLRSRLSGDLDALLRDRASTLLSSIGVAKGQLVVREAPGDHSVDKQVWVFAGSRTLERPQADPATNAAALKVAAHPGTYIDVPRDNVRLHSASVTRNRRQMGVLVAGVSLTPYQKAANDALLASLGFALAALAAILLAARWSIGAALRPVDRMTAEAAEWSEHDLSHRFAVHDPPDELSRLAATFNDLLGRIGASLRHEQRWSAEVSHELRTPLTRLIGEVDLALRRPRSSDAYREVLAAIRRDATQMHAILETLLAVARRDAGLDVGTSDAGAVAARAAQHAPAPEHVAVLVQPTGAPVRVGADAEVAERMLAPVIENACRFAASRVSIAVASVDGHVVFTVSDDGPGVDAEEAPKLFQPGYRASPANGNGNASSGAAAGLGLALAQRLANSAGGEIECVPAAHGGRFVIRLPAA
jgi:signal transduction histidine kinase